MALMQSTSGAMGRPAIGLPYSMPVGHVSCRPELASAARAVTLRPSCQTAARVVPPGASATPWELCSVGSDVQPALPVTPRTPSTAPTADVSPCLRVSSNSLPWGFAGERDNPSTVRRQTSTLERSMTPSYPVRSFSAVAPGTPTQAVCWSGQPLPVAQSQRTASPAGEVQVQVEVVCSPRPPCQAHSRVGHHDWQSVASDASLATGPGHRASVDSLPYDGSPVSSVATRALYSDSSKDSAGVLAGTSWRSMGTGRSCTGHASQPPASAGEVVRHGSSVSAGPSVERQGSLASLVDEDLDAARSPSIEDPKESMKVLWSARRVFRRSEGLDSSTSMNEEIEAISSPDEPQASMKLLWRDGQTERLFEGTGSSSSSNAEPPLDVPAKTRPRSVPRLMNLRKALYGDSKQTKQDTPSSGGLSSRASLQCQRITGSLGACGSSLGRQKAPSSARAAESGSMGSNRAAGFYSPRRQTVGRPMPWEESTRPTDLATAACAAVAAVAAATSSTTPSTARSSLTPRGGGKGRVCTSPPGHSGSCGPVHTLQRAAVRGLPGSPRHRHGSMQDAGSQDKTRGSSLSPVRCRQRATTVTTSNRLQVRCTRPREFAEPLSCDPPKAPKMVPRILQLGQPAQQQKQQQEQQQQQYQSQCDATASAASEQVHRMAPWSIQLGQPHRQLSLGPLLLGPFNCGFSQQDSDGVSDPNKPSEQRRPSPRCHTSPALRPAPMQAMPGTFGWVPPRKSSGGASPGTVRLKERCASVISKCTGNELEPTCGKSDIPAAVVPVPLHGLPGEPSVQDMQKLLLRRRTLGGA